MSKAKKGHTVKVHYTGSLADGTIFDSSSDREPIEFIIGGGMVIEGFDDMVTGMQVGDTKKETLPSHKAYGERRDELVGDVPKDNIPEDIRDNVAVGDKLQIPQPNGIAIVTITNVTDDTITIDANAELAGKDLTFEIELIDITEPTEKSE
ncbi:MAG: peptidylprolyl isomerase [Candidatus Magasanikbacteria bacterium CG10_big_fil_rev_8_21_14_0_10_42_10]|uniref:Peptidyl-prolyl cis-trans isomerase n=2 Tax=Candidatus Magasanikiibacteriota TaxID=1752731 RepID=A0A2H0TYG6_9BACT|nr:MAG: peptidylprolyl isomerase [Candidatus Magasanikbacteria bacterium CG10_big_fil_rev_8_21_14_0_10_42_10]PIZ92679.1 MAG: peptidylprolyl isomerase [Candidatus Magasanikbacteria bacterium CG_4_10_14_0_2_um_filter_41_10]